MFNQRQRMRIQRNLEALVTGREVTEDTDASWNSVEKMLDDLMAQSKRVIMSRVPEGKMIINGHEFPFAPAFRAVRKSQVAWHEKKGWKIAA